MKLYEAIESIVSEFGKEIINNAKVINMFNDYNAFEESRTFKIILKNLIAEGYMDQILYVRDWSKTQSRIISNFIAATSFNEVNASYVILSLAYGLGYIKKAPTYQPSSVPTQPTSSPSSNPKQAKAQNQPAANSSSINGVCLDKTPSQIERLSEASQQKYKEAAEAYLESIVEFKTDFERELGVKIKTYMEFELWRKSILPKFEINGKIKVKYDYSIIFNVLLYDHKDRMMIKEQIYVGVKRNPYEVVQTFISPSDYHKVSNIKRIVVYWEKN